MGAIIIVVLLTVGIGVVSLVAPDLMWSSTRWRNELKGVKSERTATWEIGRVVGGILIILFGLVFGLWSWGVTSGLERDGAWLTEVYVEREATQRADAILLDETFSGAISELMETANAELQTVRANTLGVDAEDNMTIAYGRCQNTGNFYMYVFNYARYRPTYAYHMGQEWCDLPDQFYAGNLVEMGQSESGGTWYSVPGLGMPMPTHEATTPIPAGETVLPDATPEATED